MYEFWGIATQVAGLGAVGLFVFWSICKGILALDIFPKQTREQANGLLRLIVWLAGGLAVFAIVAFVVVKLSGSGAATAQTAGNGNVTVNGLKAGRDNNVTINQPPKTRPAEISLLAERFNDDEPTVIDVVLKNTGGQVGFVKEAVVNVDRIWKLTANHKTITTLLPSERYFVRLSVSQPTPYTVRKQLNQDIRSGEPDRFFLELRTDAPTNVLTDYVFLLRVNLITDEGKAIDTGPYLFMTMGDSRYTKSLNPNTAKALDEIGLEKGIRSVSLDYLLKHRGAGEDSGP
jgi:hypothetical protein